MNRIDIALDYAKHGARLFRLLDNDKRPAYKNPEGKATNDPVKIQEAYDAAFGCNFGFYPDTLGCLVIDLDCHNGKNGKKSLDDWLTSIGEALPATYTVKTPSGGTHLYFKTKNAVYATQNGFLDGVDIRGAKGYVVIAGSETDKGTYTPEGSLDHIATLPEWFASKYTKVYREFKKSEINYNLVVRPDTEDKIERALEFMKNLVANVSGLDPEDPDCTVPEGIRNQTLFSLFNMWYRYGISKEKALDLYMEHGVGLIEQTDHEIEATLASAYKGIMTDGYFGSLSPEGAAWHRMFKPIDLPEPLPLDGVSGARYDVRDLASENYRSDVKWLIQDWLAAEMGYSVLFAGEGGIGKSLMILDLALALATGMDWMGNKVQRCARTLFMSCEDDPRELARRIKARNVGCIPEGAIQFWDRTSKTNYICEFDKNDQMRTTPVLSEIKNAAESFFKGEGGVLVIDSLADIFGGNENARVQVTRFIKECLRKLAEELRVVIIVIGHPSKREGSTYSGSTAWNSSFRCRWLMESEVVEEKRKKAKSGRIKVSVDKCNFAPTNSEFFVRMGSKGTFYLAPTAGYADFPEDPVEVTGDMIIEAIKNSPNGYVTMNPREKCKSKEAEDNSLLCKYAYWETDSLKRVLSGLVSSGKLTKYNKFGTLTYRIKPDKADAEDISDEPAKKKEAKKKITSP